MTIKKLIYLSLLLFSFHFIVTSQTIDSLKYKKCYDNIKKLFGQDVSCSGPFSIHEIENMYKVTIEKAGKKESIPFGYENDKWKELKLKIKNGDKIFEFTTGTASWENLAGRAGIIIFRGNNTLGILITSLN